MGDGTGGPCTSSEANKKNLFCETVFSERENETIGKLSSKAHSGRGQISLRKKNSLAAIIINLQPTRERPIFLCSYFYGFYLKESFFFFLINFNFFSLRLNWVLGWRAGWWLDERNHPAYVMTNQLTKCALRLRIHPFFEKCKIHFFIFAEYNYSSAHPWWSVLAREPLICSRLTILTFVRGSGWVNRVTVRRTVYRISDGTSKGDEV